MIAYSIKDLENLTGIKAHTLRIWEKRYGIIQPQRTETNIRYFTEDDVQKVLHITLLNRKGHKISKIAKMTSDEIIKQVAQHAEVTEDFQNELDALMMAIFELDATKFNLILDNQINYYGLEYVINVIFYPLLDKLSLMWMAGSVKGVHETFVTNAIKRKIIHQIENIKVKEYKRGVKVIIFLPENETHELSTLFAEYILAKNHIKAINLGINVALIDVLEASYIYESTHIFTIFNDSFSETQLKPYLVELDKNVHNTEILISGFQVSNQNIASFNKVVTIDGLDHFKSYLGLP
jgi:MerR family transcriptional regulator, light-induced transcriptional regulator